MRSALCCKDFMTTVFINHSYLEKDAARALADALRAAGLDAWLAEEQFIAGQDLPSSLSDAVAKADAVVALLSKRSQQSAWLSLEVAAAIAHDKRVIPVLLDEEVDVPFVLCDRAQLSLTGPGGYTEVAQKIARSTEVPSNRDQELRSRAENVSLQRAEMERERKRLWHMYQRREAELRARSFTIFFVLVCTSGAGLLYLLDRSGSGSNFLWLAIGILAGAATVQITNFLSSKKNSASLEKEVENDAS